MTGQLPLCAVVDIGTNSVRLLVAEGDGTSPARQVERHIRVTRLGQDVDKTGALHPDAIARTAQVLTEFAEIWRRFGITNDRVVLMATSAARDACNAEVFTTAAITACGVTPAVISGALEAEIAFLGATADQPPGPMLVVDIGGGSTEFVLADKSGSVIGSTSRQIGCVRLTERSGSPPYTEAQVHTIRVSARSIIDEAVDLLPRPIDSATTLIGVAGTVTTLAALELGLPTYQPERIHGTQLTQSELKGWINRLTPMKAQAIEALGPVEGNRGDVLPVGAIILDEIMSAFGLDAVIASEHDSLDGMCTKLLAGDTPRELDQTE